MIAHTMYVCKCSCVACTAKDVTSPEKKDDKCDKKTDDLPELQKLSLQEENKSPAKADASGTSDVSSPTKTEQNSVSPKPVEVK